MNSGSSVVPTQTSNTLVLAQVDGQNGVKDRVPIAVVATVYRGAEAQVKVAESLMEEAAGVEHRLTTA